MNTPIARISTNRPASGRRISIGGLIVLVAYLALSFHWAGFMVLAILAYFFYPIMYLQSLKFLDSRGGWTGRLSAVQFLVVCLNWGVLMLFNMFGIQLRFRTHMSVLQCFFWMWMMVPVYLLGVVIAMLIGGSRSREHVPCDTS